ncbi:hypothetical protein FB451DRAFT_484218 [Mycena latifolia]|nr:hypothetical protein FB451DRAFT_484218 [Mycena latifolia]
MSRPLGSLDVSERYLIASQSAKESSTVFFFGVFVIDKLAWLSPAGKDLLTKELNKRDIELSRHRSSQNSRKSVQLRQLTLHGLYGQMPGGGSKIKAWIRCEKESPAMFLTATNYTKSLLIKSKEQHRTYEIISIDRPIYDLSRNFLERYRLVALISEIIDKYKITSNSMEVDNFVTAYLLQHKENRLSHGVIFNEDIDNPPVNPLLRHISRAEIRSIFAAHSAWLLAFYLLPKQSNKNPINVRSWCDFIGKVRIAKAASKSGSWGKTYEDDEIWDPDTGSGVASIAKTLEKFGSTAAEWEKKLTKAYTTLSPARTDTFEDHRPTASGSKRSMNYDSDFSEPSTPGCSDSEYDSDSVSPPFPVPRILLHMSQPPVLLPGRFIWDCPIPKCTHSIDFMKLSPRDLEAVKDPTFADVYLRQKQYATLRDENVQRALQQMVSQHYCGRHLGVNGANLTPQKQKLFMEELSNKWRQHLPES